MDQTLFFLINRHWVHPILNWLMAVLTDWDFWMPFILAISIFVGIWGSFRLRMALICAVLCLGLVDSVAASMKHFFGRPRPYMTLDGAREVELAHTQPRVLALAKPLYIHYSQPNKATPPHGKSFPSAHAANNFAVATVFFLFFRRWGWVFFILAILVSYSRIYVGAHWPSDVVAGALVGIFVSLLLTKLLEWTWKHWTPRLFPRLTTAHPSLLPSKTENS